MAFCNQLSELSQVCLRLKLLRMLEFCCVSVARYCCWRTKLSSSIHSPIFIGRLVRIAVFCMLFAGHKWLHKGQSCKELGQQVLYLIRPLILQTTYGFALLYIHCVLNGSTHLNEVMGVIACSIQSGQSHFSVLFILQHCYKSGISDVTPCPVRVKEYLKLNMFLCNGLHSISMPIQNKRLYKGMSQRVF